MNVRKHFPRYSSNAVPKIALPFTFVVLMTACGSAALADGLDASMTPVGAEKAASTTGIPAFAPETLGPGWSYGKKRGDFFKYKGDKPLYVIDAANVDKYAAQLSAGQVALIKQTKGYTMPVYPSRRTCGFPDYVNENTKKNIGFAKMAADGTSLADAHLPGVPFPVPKTGAEAMWNTKTSYRGVGMELPNQYTTVSPRKGSNEWIKIVSDTWFYYPWAHKGDTNFSKVDQIEGYNYFTYKSPTALAGQAAIFAGYAAKPGDAYYYFAGQRRVRRMPSYAYDAPQIGFDNQYTIDESYVFSGLMDRFDWKLVGKKEMLVPYNSFGMYDFTAKFEDAYQQDFVSPAHRRYELHRVWVVEANVKPGARHSAPKRLFYIDEDSWTLVGAVDYDAQGNITKVREGHVMPVYETGACASMTLVQYNLVDGRYLTDGSMLAAGKDAKWVVEPGTDPHYSGNFYTAENLRALSER